MAQDVLGSIEGRKLMVREAFMLCRVRRRGGLPGGLVLKVDSMAILPFKCVLPHDMLLLSIVIADD